MAALIGQRLGETLLRNPMSTDSHIIRLRGPWNFEILADGAQCAAGILDFGGDWREVPVEPLPGALLLRRRFGRPGHLDPEEHVTLIVEGKGVARATFQLNGAEWICPEGELTSRRGDITGLLQPRNELTIQIEREGTDSSGARLLTDVRLEIDFA